MPSSKRSPETKAAPVALVVLGMHRSGTSALANLLAVAGADPGERLVPGSAGNEAGHWEDAFAVETNQRLLASLGRRWDDVRALPAGWLQAEAVEAARHRIIEYVRGSRLAHPLWAIKDPRMCLLADAWLPALAEAGCRAAVLLMVRHPQEVAASLAARDGMATARAHLLWARHMLEAERSSRGIPRRVLTYEQLLEAPVRVLERVRGLPGCAALGAAGRAAGDVVRKSARHHRAREGSLPQPIEAVWAALCDASQRESGASEPDRARMDRFSAELEDADRLYAPVVAELEREQDTLWRRTARAEAAVAHEVLSGGGGEAVAQLAGDLARVRMEHADAVARAAELSAMAGLARDLSPAQDQLRDGLAGLSGRVDAMARDVVPGLAGLRSGIEAVGSELKQAIAGELRWLRQRNAAQADALLARASEISALQAQAKRAREDAAKLGDRIERQAVELRDREHQLVSVKQQVLSLQADSELLHGIQGSRSWRFTQPLRLAARVMRGGVTREDKARVRRWLAAKLAATRVLSLSFRSGKWRVVRGATRVTGTAVREGHAAPGARPDVFMWAVIDWHFRTQRPQHLARALVAAGHRVFYLSNNLVDDPQPGFNLEQLDGAGCLFQVFLNAAGAPEIYFGMPSAETVAQLRRSFGVLMQWADSDGGFCMVQHPFWSDVASRVPGAALLYDCMDHHAGFDDNAPDVLAAEARLARNADLLVVTSAWLDRELADANPNRVVVRNAVDFAHFRDPPPERYRDKSGRRIIGYYGAIAAWFDVDLVRAVARTFPDCLVLLVGSDTAGVANQLADEPNVAFAGEVPYARLPFYLHAFDVALLPFKVRPLTLATNPVKAYEYLGAGKPVVAVDLPEIRQFGSLVYRARGPGEFLERVGEALQEADAGLEARRIAFAGEQTWAHRARELDAAMAGLAEPRVSVIVLACNNLEFTRACLHSVLAESNWRNLEVIVVDNASDDGTRDFLREWVAAGPGRRIILNEGNLGFSAGNNVGLAAATGDYLVLLNNDTYVTPNWVRTMVNHLRREPGIGLLGPVTNNIGNEARIEIHYADMGEMKRAAAKYTRQHAGVLFDIATVGFFCVAMPRSTYERVGPMDESFGVGYFEDDDYCRRVQAVGLRVACAEDVFVHHHLSASFDRLGAERKRELFSRNKAVYEAKWGPWIPHAYRETR